VAKRLLDQEAVAVSPQTVALWARNAGKNRSVGDVRLAISGEELRPLYEAGASTIDLARRFHVSRTLVGERLKEVGTQMRHGWTKYPSLSLESLRRMYWTEGLSTKEVAARTGCSQMTVHYRLRRYGIPRKRHRRSTGPRGVQIL
jgi:transcriptional regulator of aromatic amino acid metabolism